MERRKFLLGMGAVAAGGAAALSTGAVDSGILTDRTVELQVAGSDRTAAVSIVDGDSNGVTVSYDTNGKAQVNVQRMNADATYNYDEAFSIQNQNIGNGDEGDFEVWFELQNNLKGANQDQYVYNGGNPAHSIDTSGEAVPIDIGSSETFGIHVSSEGLRRNDNAEYILTINLEDQG
jgi:hypothetical protein